jgi:hypothetical protein
MDWIQFFGFILTIGGLFIWNRTESNADRRELRQCIDSIRETTQAQLNAIQQEIKDFHGRLCNIEERNKK